MKASIGGPLSGGDRKNRVRSRGEQVRSFILSNVGDHPNDINLITSRKFGITRQAANKHLQKLVLEKVLVPEGKTRERSYELASLVNWTKRYILTPDLAEDLVWSQDVAPILVELPKNVLDIWNYCFTEMLNNAIDHSGGDKVTVTIARTAIDTRIWLMDDGVGIFRKIQNAMGLVDERHAVVELAKGKLTTDPARHTGQGIFFASRLVDTFNILSGGVFFAHNDSSEKDWVLETSQSGGTTVLMKLDNHSSRTDKEIFDEYSSGDGYGFTKTVVPVSLAQHGEDKLVSRSQAKRLLSRVDQFHTVIFDFAGVETIGQGFADEIFRVFARSHPGIEIEIVNAKPQVQQMVRSAQAQWAADIGGI